MVFLFFLIGLTQSKYSWTLDRINQYSFIPDFRIETYNSDKNPIDVYVIDSGISLNKYFYNNIVEKKNFINLIKDDENGHGTFVTSLISSKYYGVTNNINIHSLKVFGIEGSTKVNYLFDSLEYVKEQCKTLERCIVNLSLGMSKRIDAIDNLLTDMFNENILIIAAAGNDNKDCKDFTPSNLDSILVVGSIDYLNIKSKFSNYGACVDIYTYGELVPGLGLKNLNIMSGTSMSTPIITGYISNFWSNNYNLTNKEVIKFFLKEYTYETNNLKIFKIESKILNDLIMIIFINISLLPFYIIFYILFKCNRI